MSIRIFNLNYILDAKIIVYFIILCFYLIVSQFTLYGFLKGNKPDFHVAMAPQRAKPFYASLVDRFRNAYNSDAIKGMLCFLSFNFHFSFSIINTVNSLS